MAKAEGNGQQVNIPALAYVFDGVTESSIRSGLLDFRSGDKGGAQANPRAAARRIQVE